MSLVNLSKTIKLILLGYFMLLIHWPNQIINYKHKHVFCIGMTTVLCWMNPIYKVKKIHTTTCKDKIYRYIECQFVRWTYLNQSWIFNVYVERNLKSINQKTISNYHFENHNTVKMSGKSVTLATFLGIFFCITF